MHVCMQDQGYTPLHHAALHGHVGAMRVLVDAGAGVNKRAALVWCGWRSAHLACHVCTPCTGIVLCAHIRSCLQTRDACMHVPGCFKGVGNAWWQLGGAWGQVPQGACMQFLGCLACCMDHGSWITHAGSVKPCFHRREALSEANLMEGLSLQPSPVGCLGCTAVGYTVSCGCAAERLSVCTAACPIHQLISIGELCAHAVLMNLKRINTKAPGHCMYTQMLFYTLISSSCSTV